MVTLIGIDLGTTGVRVGVYNIRGEVLATGKSSIHAQNVESWVDALMEATPSGLLRSFKPEEKIVTVDSTSGTALLVDKHGFPVYLPLMYYETAPDEFNELVKYDSVHELTKRGVKISPTSPLPKIMRIMCTSPSSFGKVKWILPPTSWLLYRLHFKEGDIWRDVAVDWTNALKFGEDISGGEPCWFTAIFKDANVPVDLLPLIVPCGEFLGLAESKLAERLGLKGAKLYQGMTDGNASALATGCLEPGDFGLGCGTTTVPKFVCEELKPHPALYYHKHPIRGFLAGAAPVTGAMLEWVAEKVFGISIDEAFSLATNVKPGEEEYFYFPQGDRSPFNDPILGASLLKLWPDHKTKEEVRGKIFRSMLLGITFFEYLYIQLFEKTFKTSIEDVKLTGGGARNRMWNAIRAAVYERTVKVMEERAGIGALIPVVLKLNLFKDASEASSMLLKVTDVVNPDEELASKYRLGRDLFIHRWKKIRETLHIKPSEKN